MKKLIGLLALASIGGSASATVWGFAIPVINGSQEVPPNASAAYGTASFVIDDVTREVAGSMNIFDLPLAVITGAHIHYGPVGVNGPVWFDLLGNQVPGSPIVDGNMITFIFRGTLLAQANIQDIIDGDAYINVHTQQFPGGEIRGQIECTGVVPEPATLAALGIGGLVFLRRRRR